jgi:hypothetical protein
MGMVVPFRKISMTVQEMMMMVVHGMVIGELIQRITTPTSSIVLL